MNSEPQRKQAAPKNHPASQSPDNAAPETELESPTVASAQMVNATSPPLDPKQVSYLQRTIGNQATLNLMRKRAAREIQTTPSSSVLQRGLFSIFDSPAKKQQKKQQKEQQWNTLLTGYSAAKAGAWISSVSDEVEAQAAEYARSALMGLQGQIQTKAVENLRTALETAITSLQDQISHEADEEQKRKLTFDLQRKQQTLSQLSAKVQDQIATGLAADVQSSKGALLLTKPEISDKFDQTDFVSDKLADFLQQKQAENKILSEKDLDSQVKKHMNAIVKPEAFAAIQQLINTYVQDPANIDTLVGNLSTQSETKVGTAQTEEDQKKDTWNQGLEGYETDTLTAWKTPIETRINTEMLAHVKQQLTTDDRKQAVIAEIKRGIATQIAEVEARLDGQIALEADPVAKKRLELERANVEERFGKQAEALADGNEAELKKLVDALATAQVMDVQEVKDAINPAIFLRDELRNVLDPKREQQKPFDAKAKKALDKEIAPLQKTLSDQAVARAKTAIDQYMQSKKTQIANAFATALTQGDEVHDVGTEMIEKRDTADQDAKLTVDEAKLETLRTDYVMKPIIDYLANKFGKEGMGWTKFRSEKAKAFRDRMKNAGRQKAYEEIEATKTTHAKTSHMTETGQNYIAHLAKNKAYKLAKESVNDEMSELAAAEAEALVPVANVLYELDIAWRDGAAKAKEGGKQGASIAKAGEAAAKARTPAVVAIYQDLAKKRKNFLFGKAAVDESQTTSTTDTGKIEQDVEGKVSTDRVANKAITAAIKADSITQGYNKLANLINFFVPNPGDETKIELQIRVPGPDGASFFVFTVRGGAERKKFDEVKANFSVLVGGGLQFWGGDATFQVGYMIEAQADSADKLGMLMSYGTYRQMSSSSPSPLHPIQKLAYFLWGGLGVKYDEQDPSGNSKADNTSKNFAELWAAMVEEHAMQRFYLPSKTNPAHTPAVGEDAFREKDGFLNVTKEPVRTGQQEGREYLGKVSHVAQAPKSINVGDYAFTYSEDTSNPAQATKANDSDAITKGVTLYAEDWSSANITVTTKAQKAGTGGAPAQDNHLIGKVKSLREGGTQVFVDGRSDNYVDVGFLVEAAGKVNFGVGKAEGTAAYQRLSRYSKQIIDEMTLDKFGKADPTMVDQKRRELGLENSVSGGGQMRNVVKLEGKTEFDVGPVKLMLGLEGSFIWVDGKAKPVETEIKGKVGLPSEFLDEELAQTNMIVSRIAGSFAAGAKTLIGRLMIARKENQQTTDRTGVGGAMAGTLTDLTSDVAFPVDQLLGTGLGDALIKAGGESGAMDTVNDTVQSWFTDEMLSSSIGKAVNRFAVKNELDATIIWKMERGRHSFSFDLKQVKGGEVDLGVLKAKIEKSKELLKFQIGQEDKQHKMHDVNPPTARGDKAYFKDGKITTDKTNDFAGKVVKPPDVTNKVVTVRSWSPGGQFLGIDF